MNRIYMKSLKTSTDGKKVKLAVFFKGGEDHLKDLMGFLKNQKIKCSIIPESKREHMHEFSYFHLGFYIEVSPTRWSFYDLRSYIQAYVNSWEDDALFRDNLPKELKSAGEEFQFNDGFYVQMAREIDRHEDLYYQESMSISLFISSILKLLQKNLQLYWAAAKLTDFRTGNLSYLNYYPTILPRNDIIKACAGRGRKIVNLPVNFRDEHLADFFLRTGPFSPKRDVVEKFLSFVLMLIDDFIYGDAYYKRITYRMQCEITELRKGKVLTTPDFIEREEKARRKSQLLLMGASRLSASSIYSEFARHGFSRQNVELLTDFEKIPSFDTNALLAVRSRYDGLLLGPMPHRVKGDFLSGNDLITQVRNEPARYPPFVIVRDKSRGLKITKTSLQHAIEELVDKMDQVAKYNVLHF